MFDIGFWELLLISIVALLVIGPSRLPEVARTVGLWVGRAQRMVQSVKSDIQRELENEHLKNVLEEQKKEIDDLSQTIMDLQSLIDETEKAKSQNIHTTDKTDSNKNDDAQVLQFESPSAQAKDEGSLDISSIAQSFKQAANSGAVPSADDDRFE